MLDKKRLEAMKLLKKLGTYVSMLALVLTGTSFKSIACTLWVMAPIEILSTPVEATFFTFLKLILPDAVLSPKKIA